MAEPTVADRLLSRVARRLACAEILRRSAHAACVLGVAYALAVVIARLWLPVATATVESAWTLAPIAGLALAYGVVRRGADARRRAARAVDAHARTDDLFLARAGLAEGRITPALAPVLETQAQARAGAIACCGPRSTTCSADAEHHAGGGAGRGAQQEDAEPVCERAVGGRVLRHHWFFHACTIEIPRFRLEAIAGHPSTAVLSPNEERKPSSAATRAGSILPAPIGGSRSPDNHNIDAAHLLLGHEGQNANVALFDTGVDLDQTGEAAGGGSIPDPDHHRAFLTGSLSRILHAERVGGIDCNDAAVDPWCPAGFPAVPYPSARHGTGVAAIAVGARNPDDPPPPAPALFDEGHAPDASLLSFSISNPSGAGEVWPTDTSVVLAAVERLSAWLLENMPKRVHVLNVSYSLWPDPQDPTQLALDLLEREFDVLVVASASNEGDATGVAPGFTNGLSVGNVHKWKYEAGTLTTRYPNRDSSRGPLFGDPGRYYPDVCASGASAGVSRASTVSQIAMPLIDDKHLPNGPNICRGVSIHHTWYDAAGTSMASPQVAGAAALYRAERSGASALETKAAVLLATVDLLQADVHLDLHTYIDRNATGVGYVRDDLLARYAKYVNLPSGPQNPDNAQGTSVVLTPQAPSVSIPYTGLTVGSRYAVVAAWPRVFEDDFDPSSGVEVPWPDVNLEVVTTGGSPTLIARSDSTRNTYERLVFKAPDTSVSIRATVDDFQGADAVPAFVAHRLVTQITVTVNGSPVAIESRRSIPGYVAPLAQLPTCTHSVPDQTVSRTLPASYRQAYGSAAFALGGATPAPTSNSTFWSLPVGATGSGHVIVENLYAASELGGGGAFTIGGVALRSWKPFPGCDGTLSITRMYVYRKPHTAGTPLSGLLYGAFEPTSTTLVAANLSIPVHAPTWSARSFDTWPVVIPFSTPFNVAATGDALGVWMRFDGDVCSGSGYGVDYVDDGSIHLYALFRSGWGAVGGAGAVLGLMEGTTGTRGVTLDMFGFPRPPEGTGATSVLFQVRQATPNSVAVIGLGLSNPNVTIGSCAVLSSLDLYVTSGLPTSTMGDATWSLTLPAGLLHQHTFAQAATASGLYSNGLRLTIGGIAP